MFAAFSPSTIAQRPDMFKQDMSCDLGFTIIVKRLNIERYKLNQLKLGTIWILMKILEIFKKTFP